MARTCSYYPVLLITLLARLSSGSDAYEKSVCIGDSIQMFNSIHITNPDTVVNLFRNSDKNRVIAMWTNTSSSIKQENVVMDGDKNIWIINVHQTDGGSYFIQYDIRNKTPSTTKIELSVWVAPAVTCKPKVKQSGRFLTATLEGGDDCGKPKVSVYLKECLEEVSGVICDGKAFAQLQSEREAGTFHACMVGSALRCARNSDPSSNQCSASKIEATQTQLDTGGNKTHPGIYDSQYDIMSWIIGILVLQIIGPAILFTSYVLYKKYRRRKKEGQKDSSELEGQKDSSELETMV